MEIGLEEERCRWPRGGNWRTLWYGDRLSPRVEAEGGREAESVFREVGLVGEFWKLSE